MCRIDPLDFAKESAQLINLIDKLTLNQPILQPPMQALCLKSHNEELTCVQD